MNEDFMTARELNHATSITDVQLDDIMDYHKWDDAKIEKGQRVRNALKEAIRTIITCVPPSPDRSAAIRKLREARMDCNSALTFDGRF